MITRKTGRNQQRTDSRSRTQSLSEMKVKQHPSSSLEKTNATRSRLYVQRKTPAVTSNNRSSISICQAKQEDRHGRSSGRQEMLGGSRSKSVSSVVSGREEDRMGTQTQRSVGAGRTASSGINKQTKDVSLRDKSSGKRGSISKSIPNLYNPSQPLVEAEKKRMKRSDQVYTSPSKGYTHNSNPTTYKKNPVQGNEGKVTKVWRPREKLENVTRLPRERDLALRRPSIHESLININQECEEVILLIFPFAFSFFSCASMPWNHIVE